MFSKLRNNVLSPIMELQSKTPSIPSNGYIQNSGPPLASTASEAAEAAEASEPMLAFSTLNSSGKAVKVTNEGVNGSHKTSTGGQDLNNSRSRWSNYQVIQCLVLLLILLLITTLCSVFIKPELYFTDYGKSSLL